MNPKYFSLKVILIISFAAIFCFQLINLQAQINPGEIIEKSVEAMGGKDAFEKFHDFVLTASLKIFAPQGAIIGAQKVYGKTEPYKFRAEQTVHGMQIITGFDGQTVWVEQMGNVMVAPPIVAEPIKASAARENVLFRYKERGCKVQYLGESEVDSQPCHQIKITDKEGNETIYHFNVSTYYPLKSAFNVTLEDGIVMKNEIVNSDFRMVGNLMKPFKIIAYINENKSMETEVIEFKANQDLEDSLFAMPKKK